MTSAIKYSRGSLSILDCLELPLVTSWIPVPDAASAHAVIKAMQVRGAPAIGIVACLGLAVEAQGLPAGQHPSAAAAAAYLSGQLTMLRTSRPTAVNLFNYWSAGYSWNLR